MAKILVVEDEAFLSEALTNKLKKCGYDVKPARDGEEATKLVADFQPSVVLLDIRMPKKDGFTVLQEIRQNPKTKSIKVIILSNFGENTEITKAKSLGADDYFIKANLKLADLLERIKTHLG